jgi:hypothetical protein
MALIDTLPLPKEQARIVLDLNRRVNEEGEEIELLTPSQLAALQAAYDALKSAGRSVEHMKAHAERLGLKV